MTSPNETIQLSIGLSNEELSFILRYMQLGNLPGYPIPEETNADVDEIAVRGLIAKSFATIENGQLILAEQVVGAIAAGARTQRALSIRVDSDDNALASWLYLVPDFSVYHSQPYPGVHQFQTVSDVALVIALFTSVTQAHEVEEKRKPTGNHATVPADVYRKFGQLNSQGDTAAAVALLKQHRVSEDAIQTILNPTLRTIFTLVQQNKKETVATSRMVLRADVGYWLVEASQKEVQIIPADRDMMMEHVTQLLTANLV